jgi:hypothetical protein
MLGMIDLAVAPQRHLRAPTSRYRRYKKARMTCGDLPAPKNIYVILFYTVVYTHVIYFPPLSPFCGLARCSQAKNSVGVTPPLPRSRSCERREIGCCEGVVEVWRKGIDRRSLPTTISNTPTISQSYPSPNHAYSRSRLAQ